MKKAKLTAPKISENDLRNQILDYLKLRKIKAWRNNCGRRGHIRFSPIGSGDIFALFSRTFVSIETKTTGEKPSDAQNNWINEVRSAGHVAFWVDNFDEAKNTIDYLFVRYK